MRRRRQKQPVFEFWREVADRLGDLRVDRVFAGARGGGVMGLVENQQRAGPEIAQRVDETPL